MHSLVYCFGSFVFIVALSPAQRNVFECMSKTNSCCSSSLQNDLIVYVKAGEWNIEKQLTLDLRLYNHKDCEIWKMRWLALLGICCWLVGLQLLVLEDGEWQRSGLGVVDFPYYCSCKFRSTYTSPSLNEKLLPQSTCFSFRQSFCLPSSGCQWNCMSHLTTI